jgi:glutamate-1-semialdehyde 2,1-aminomutase
MTEHCSQRISEGEYPGRVSDPLARRRIRDLAGRERAALDARTPTSARRHERASSVLAGGVASSFQLREPWPIHLSHGAGARVWDVDGNEYLDFHNGFSSMLQGHAHPAIVAAVARRHARGAHFAAPTEDTVVVAEELARRWGLARWRFTNSGSESTMGAIRIARALTGRPDVLRIFGSYHGHHDTVLVGIGAGHGAGVPRSTVDEVHNVEFNDALAMERRISQLDREGRKPSCVIMEAAMTNLGVVLPREGYLEAVREVTRRHGVLLIFDEVKTGLAIAAGGAVERFGVRPDMVTLAKTLGGGLPVGAIGMTERAARVVEDGSVHLFGTYNGNPLGMAAARANLLEVLTPAAYRRLAALNERLMSACAAVIAEQRLPACTAGIGSKGCVTFGAEPVVDHRSFKRRHDPELTELAWLWSMNRGLLVTPGREPEWNLTVAHDEAAVDRYAEVFAELAAELSGRAAELSPRPFGSARA